jgi:hypothetical protein
MGVRALVAVACIPGAALAAPPEKPPADAEATFNVKLGYDRTVGKYDQQRNTTLETSSVTATLESGDYSLDLVASYLKEKGPGRVIFLPGRRPIIIVGPDRKASGPGDVTVGLTRYLLNEEDHHLDLDLGAIVKLPTASSTKGLGTGEKDVSVQAAFGKSLGDLSATLTTGYTFVGKAPDLDLKNAAYASLDASYKIADPFSVGATYSVGQTSAKGTQGSRDLTGYLDFKVKKLKIELYLLKGYSTQSPDRGGGITVACDLW